MRKWLRAALAQLFVIIAMVVANPGCGGVGATPEASVADTPSKGPVGKTIRSNSEKFVACARDSVTIQTGTTQNLILRFVVQPDGQVFKARIENISAPDPDLQGCVLRALKKLKFPSPSDKKSKEITYPLVLRPE